MEVKIHGTPVAGYSMLRVDIDGKLEAQAPIVIEYLFGDGPRDPRLALAEAMESVAGSLRTHVSWDGDDARIRAEKEKP